MWDFATTSNHVLPPSDYYPVKKYMSKLFRRESDNRKKKKRRVETRLYTYILYTCHINKNERKILFRPVLSHVDKIKFAIISFFLQRAVILQPRCRERGEQRNDGALPNGRNLLPAYTFTYRRTQSGHKRVTIAKYSGNRLVPEMVSGSNFSKSNEYYRRTFRNIREFMISRIR